MFIEKGYIEMSFELNFIVCLLNFFLYYFLGQPYLWARLDRKPNKLAEKRFKNFLHSKQNSKGLWVLFFFFFLKLFMI